jgi:hypothetical protein
MANTGRGIDWSPTHGLRADDRFDRSSPTQKFVNSPSTHSVAATRDPHGCVERPLRLRAQPDNRKDVR